MSYFALPSKALQEILLKYDKICKFLTLKISLRSMHMSKMQIAPHLISYHSCNKKVAHHCTSLFQRNITHYHSPLSLATK